MKSGGNSVGAAGAVDVANPQVEMREPTANDYAMGTIGTAAGAGLVIGSAFALKSEGSPLIGVGLAGIGTGFALWGIASFRGRPMDADATGRRLQLGGAYLASLGTTFAGIGAAIDGSKKDEGTPLYIGAGLAAVGLGLTVYTVYKDYKGVKEDKPGLFGELMANLAVGSHGVGTAVRF